MTQWSKSRTCEGPDDYEIPEGAAVQVHWGESWNILTRNMLHKLREGTPDNPITYRYELPPVETEPFAVVFSAGGRRENTFCLSDDGEGWDDDARDYANISKSTVRFYDKHGNPVEPDTLKTEQEAG